MVTCTLRNPSVKIAAARRRRSRLGLAWLTVFLALAGWTIRPPSRPSTLAAPAAAATIPSVAEPAPRIRARLKPIQDYRVGERILVDNPLGGTDEPEPDPATWKSVDLRQRKPSGRYVTMSLLLSPETMDELGIGRRRTVVIDLSEMGVKGEAEVLSISPCPDLEPGEGSIITGTFMHESDGNLVNVYIEGVEEPLGVTDSHPFFSDDRGHFVRAGELHAGERLVDLTADGFSCVLRVEPRHADEVVYNLRVNGEHVYHVGPTGVLVHNTCAGWNHMIPRGLGSNISYGAKTILTYMNKAQHTFFHSQLSAHLARYTKTVNGRVISMDPSRSSRAKVLDAFTAQERLDALKDFYMKNLQWWHAYQRELQITLGKGAFE